MATLGLADHLKTWTKMANSILPSNVPSDPKATKPPVLTVVRPFSDEDYEALRKAVKELEKTSFALQLTNALGAQLNQVRKLIPASVTAIVARAAEAAIKSAFDLALKTLGNKDPGDKRTLRGTTRLHRAAAVLSGAVGGAFGLASLPVELPVSTTIILRSIADIARHEGEDLSQPDAVLACLQVFALGDPQQSDDFSESAYLATRGLLAKSVSEATRYLVERATTDKASPILIKLISQIATRFGIIVSQKLTAQAVPLIGAAGGAAINYAFLAHFQTIAHGHFTVRRLERTYGADVVRAEYERILAESRTSEPPNGKNENAAA